jgi:hypothetical protein
MNGEMMSLLVHLPTDSQMTKSVGENSTLQKKE